MNASDSNPYAAPETSSYVPVRIRLRDQQIVRQAFLYSTFYFVGIACLVSVVAGISAVPYYFDLIVGDFTSVWLHQLLCALIPYLLLRSLTLGRIFPAYWVLYCIAGIATFPFLNFYMKLLHRDDSTWLIWIAAYLLSVASAILVELIAIGIFDTVTKRRTASTSRL